MRFNDTTILITGAGSGIGRAVADHLASEGARRLILTDIDRDALEGFRAECEVDRRVGDVADESFWDGIDLGEIDHAVVNAGVAGAALIGRMDFSEWRRILSVNLDGAFLTMRAALRAIRDGGSIVAVASAGGIKAEPGIAAYGASKAGLIQLAKVAAKEGVDRRIRVNAIAPGGVETPIWYGMPVFAERAEAVGEEAAFQEFATMATPLGRYARPEEIAAQIAFLLSDQAATITGTVLLTDGGYSL